MGRGPLAEGRPGSGGSGGARLGAAVLPPGSRDDGTRGLRRWLWAPPMLRRAAAARIQVESSSGKGISTGKTNVRASSKKY
ncbi:hypothetical protein CRG98_014151 [Punica granatum]|uniref:Uncharacterized protein n=1 Tax=Punica granatum TaxID=22663 RepID=A0A2I0KA46_PUNGR|nr:hypothetical protein CRG98_014151 [Punica granatum]